MAAFREIPSIPDLAIPGLEKVRDPAAKQAIECIRQLLRRIGNGLEVTKQAGAATVASHAILDGSVHTDSVADGVTRGSLIYGNATPKWDELVKGTDGQFLQAGASDVSWVSMSGDATLAAGVITVANNAISNAKLADMAETTVKGRAAGAGTGDPVDLTAAQLVAIIATADGAGSGLDADLLDGMSSAAFAAASHTHTTADITDFGTAQDWVLIDSESASGAASITLTGITSTYAAYKIILFNLAPATDGVELWLRTSTDGGSTYDAGAGNYQWANLAFTEAAASGFTGSTGDTEIQLTGTSLVGNAANEQLAGEVTIFRPSAAQFCRVTWQMNWMGTATNVHASQGAGCRAAAADVDAVQILFSSGNITGEARLYGLRNS